MKLQFGNPEHIRRAKVGEFALFKEWAIPYGDGKRRLVFKSGPFHRIDAKNYAMQGGISKKEKGYLKETNLDRQTEGNPYT